MTTQSKKRVRCVIYTRVSTEYGLEQDFNSLDAQRDAAEAYIRSQAHDGWTLVRTRYDDGGFSGGSTDRPALQQLLADIGDGKVDVIVVYKVDRLTRSLADFAKLVELFDSHGVSFVSVTQQFNTTTSMGRLTLNVLLSFAQFEREITSERIRDKIAASKRKGIWVGGMVPLGYTVRDRKPVIVEEEAERVRFIFNRYMELAGIGPLLTDLRKRKVHTKIRELSTGRTIGGIPFTRGSLGHLLRNRFYIGEVSYKGEICAGEQPPILDRAAFDAVQAKLADQRNSEQVKRASSEALLIGKLFDDRGNRMTPSHARKGGRKYRYYISSPLIQGTPERLGAVKRVPAVELESKVVNAVRQHLNADATLSAAELIAEHIDRVTIESGEIAVWFRAVVDSTAQQEGEAPTRGQGGKQTAVVALRPKPPQASARASDVLRIPWAKTAMKRQRAVLPPDDPSADRRPIRADSRNKLLQSIARGRRWLAELQSGALDAEAIARRDGCSKRHVNMTISLAFISPELVQAAADGMLPRGVGVARLIDAPAVWTRQLEMLGFRPVIRD
ncbi:MAG: recombinase family protein [Xanthobacteraceae bacterium]